MLTLRLDEIGQSRPFVGCCDRRADPPFQLIAVVRAPSYTLAGNDEKGNRFWPGGIGNAEGYAQDRSARIAEVAPAGEERVQGALTAEGVGSTDGERLGHKIELSISRRTKSIQKVLLDALYRENLGLAALLVGDGELMTALCAAGSKHATTVLGGHTCAKTVLIGSFAAAGLECTLHC